MMPKPKKTGYVTLNVKPDTLEKVRRYAGELQAKHGGALLRTPPLVLTQKQSGARLVVIFN